MIISLQEKYNWIMRECDPIIELCMCEWEKERKSDKEKNRRK